MNTGFPATGSFNRGVLVSKPELRTERAMCCVLFVSRAWAHITPSAGDQRRTFCAICSMKSDMITDDGERWRTHAAALSRRKQGFDSPWARQANQGVSRNRQTSCPDGEL